MAVLPFDDRDGWIWLDGRMVPWRDAKFHVLTHGLHYGSCAFEGERVYNGEVFKLTEHSERLVTSGEILGFTMPYTAAEIDDATRQVIRANSIVDGYVRPVAWRGSEMMGVSAQQNTIHVAIATWEWPSYFDPAAKMKGIKLQTSKWARPSPETAPVHAKAAGLYMICTMSKHAAEAAGYHDALMYDYRGRLAEATGANIFLVIDGEIHTPVPDCFLDGITRRTVMDLARNAGMKVVERPMWPDDLDRATEIFITGTAAEVTPVGSIDERTYTPGRITETLVDAYTKAVNEPGEGNGKIAAAE